MNIKAKILTSVLALSVLAFAFVGCDDKAPAEGTTAKQTTATAAVSDTGIASENVTTEPSDTEGSATDETVPPETAEATKETETTEAETSDREPEATEGMFMIGYETEVLGNYSEYDEYTLDDTAPSTKAVLYTDGAVKDLCFYSLTDPVVDDNGKMSFTKTELHRHDYITKDRPLVITLAFYGDIPSYGVSVTDAVGDTVTFAITMSGEDGSLILTEIG